IDANGILNVSAKDKSSGKEQKITITNSSGLSKDEVEKLRKEAELHAAEDALRKETAEARNELDNMVYGVEKQIKDAGDKIPADTKKALEDEIAKGKKVLEKQDASKDELTSAKDSLMKVIEANAQNLQAAAQAAAGAAQGAQAGGQQAQSNNNGKDGAVDADFEVVDDEPKK
ncbi:MAG: Hsp70 family protein, partial [Opitutales bacterium]|nr:Hsp70 family protein [Opitutales bacterium]